MEVVQKLKFPNNSNMLPVLQRGLLIFLGAWLNDRRQFAAAALVEADLSIRKGKKGVIAAAAYIVSRMDFSSPLAGDNGSSLDNGSIRCLYSQIFGV
jgi:hypothetical protein